MSEPVSEPSAKSESAPKDEGAAKNEAPARTRDALDANGRLRPAFLLAFPEDPELEPLIRAFERGDFRRVREEAPKLAARSPDVAVRAACEELRRRIQPDPLLYFFFSCAILLLVFLVAWSYAK